MFVSMGIPVYTVIQKEGELIILGPGVLSMRKALDWSSHITWNFGFIDHQQLSEGFKRLENDAKNSLKVSKYKF
jgi:hypothetical protein